MHEFIAWCGFLGGWLLLAGPIHQAVLELSAERYDDGQLQRVKYGTAAGDVSRWWWLVPPVWYVKQRRRAKQQRREVMTVLSPELRRTMVEYINTATGWLYVAGGGFLIAMKETWELREAYEWHSWVFWLLVAVMVTLSIGNTAVRFERARGVLAGTDPD